MFNLPKKYTVAISLTDHEDQLSGLRLPRFVTAIRVIRMVTGLGLKEAKGVAEQAGLRDKLAPYTLVFDDVAQEGLSERLFQGYLPQGLVVEYITSTTPNVVRVFTDEEHE